MSKPSLLLIGAGGHAKSCIDVIEQQNKYQIFGLVGSPDEVGSQIFNHKVQFVDGELPELVNLAEFALVAVGQIGANKNRSSLFANIVNIGFKLPVVVSPFSYISPHAVIGGGTIVMHNATINAGVNIGANCIINSHALVEHDVVVEDHCHVATSVTINGGSTIGQYSFVGSGSTIRESIHIGQMCTVGMGVTVRRSLLPNSQYVGE